MRLGPEDDSESEEESASDVYPGPEKIQVQINVKGIQRFRREKDLVPTECLGPGDSPPDTKLV